MISHLGFFETHPVAPILLLVGLALLPRLTALLWLLFGSLVSGGCLWWLGWLFAPDLLVAFLSLSYWPTNPVLVFVAWFFALGGTGVEVNRMPILPVIFEGLFVAGCRVVGIKEVTNHK